MGEFFLWVVIVGCLLGVFCLLPSVSENKDREMRNQYTQCQSAGKEWVFTEKSGFDGVCVTKK